MRARQEIGEHEIRYDNHGASVARYKHATGARQGAAWCADFASYISQNVAPGLVKPTSLAKGLMRQFVANNAFHRMTRDQRPAAGDFIFFERGDANDPWRGHVGFVVGFDAAGNLHTIEGNKHHPRYDGLIEGRDYHWSAAHPDAVRRVVYSPSELRENRMLGFGSVRELAQARHIATPTVPRTPRVQASHATSKH